MSFEWEYSLEAKIKELHAKGWTDARIAGHLDKSTETIRKTRKKLGLPAQPRSAWRKKHSFLDKHEKSIRQLHGNGAGDGEIARKFNCAPETVRLWRIRHGMPAACGEGAQFGNANSSWKGGRTIDKDGYILILSPQHSNANSHGYVREHRLVMEQQLGRPLLPNEVVHHKDENKQNNAPENLQIFDQNGEHLAETRKGRCPNWTPEGRERIMQGVKKRRLQMLGSEASQETRQRQSLAHKKRHQQNHKWFTERDERDQKIIQMHSENLSDRQIGEALKVSAETVRQSRLRLHLAANPQSNFRKKKQ